MKENENLKELKKKVKELDLIHDHLIGLDKQNLELSIKIETLESQLTEKNSIFDWYSSKFVKTIYGKYSQSRIQKIEELKNEYHEIALELNDYQKFTKSLNFQQKILEEKIEKSKKYIDDITNVLKHQERLKIIRNDFEEKEKVNTISDFLDYKEEITNKLVQCINSMSEILMISNKINNQIKTSFLEDDTSFNFQSILPPIPKMISDEIKNALQDFLKINIELKKWSIELKGLALADKKILEKLTALTKFELWERIKEEDILYFDDLSNSTFNIQKNIFHLKNQLIEEIEITRKDVINFKEEQIEIILNWVEK